MSSAIIRCRLLGEFILGRNDATQTPLRLSAQKGRALFAYLAMQPGRSAARERLATLLWGDQADRQARQNLRQCLATLRRDLAAAPSDLLIIDDAKVQLEMRALSIDVDDFLHLSNSTDPGDIEQAAALYHGPLLADFELSVEPFAEWLHHERARIESVAADIFRRLAERMDGAGRGGEAVRAAERLLVIDAFREDWQRLALRLYTRHRGRAAALAQAQAFTAQLKRELDVAPEPETVALIEHIKCGAIKPAGAIDNFPHPQVRASDLDRLVSQRHAKPANARHGEPWPIRSPYRGLAALEEKDSDYFFGRSSEVTEVLNALATDLDRLPVLLGNSGVGKSSLAQAGVLSALSRQVWPEGAAATREWPHALKDSNRWRYFRLQPGTRPVANFVETVVETWQLISEGSEWRERCADWTEKLVDGRRALRDLLAETKQRYVELQRAQPLGFFLYIDQGEELYVRAEEGERRRFSELLAEAVSGRHLHGMISLRADFFGELQKDEALFSIHRLINVPPLREAALREVINRPAKLLRARFETDHLAADIARRAAEESAKDVCTLPLLSYLLDDMWSKMVERGDSVLRLPGNVIALDGVLVDRADAFLADHPHCEENLRRMLTLKLANVREGEEPTRRRAARCEFTENEWWLVNDLAGHPYRLLVTASPEGGEAYAEVAHEAIFRRWNRLRGWIAAEREFLAWKSGLEAAQRTWQAAPESAKDDALLTGLALAQAQRWHVRRAADIPEADCVFITRSLKVAQRRRRRLQALVGALGIVIVAGLAAWLNQNYLQQTWRYYAVVRPYMLKQVRPYVLSAAAERTLHAGDTFTECAANCPQMVVVPAGQFAMGSLPDEPGHEADEEPQHLVTIATPFAVGKFAVTFDEWDACAAYGDCDPNISDAGLGRGRQPVINVDWEDAKRYVAWLSRMTGKTYRLLSEAEYEYATRAGTKTVYYWGNNIGRGNANCRDCGSAWDDLKTAPVGSFPPNPFGLYDMVGNVWQWLEDCYHDNFRGAPDDGSAWTAGDCKSRMTRGGTYLSPPLRLRNANRFRPGNEQLIRTRGVGFRVARTLGP
jgi:formylglycine-generating enzyme required for sulfatase activity/DNA-binding SARP family transcriptional activator